MGKVHNSPVWLSAIERGPHPFSGVSHAESAEEISRLVENLPLVQDQNFVQDQNLNTPAKIHDQKIKRGEGGELHQTASGATPVLTTAQGGPVQDDHNALKIGTRGPVLLEDFHFREKILHFDHERIPERVVHARGYGAHGYFETYKSLSRYTSADIFQRAGEKTPAFVRFSTVAGSKGSFDLARDVGGFAVKLYTKEGNWDIVGSNIPVLTANVCE